MKPETRAQLETEAIKNGFHKRDDGSWTKRNSPSPQPTPPVEPTATPDEATEAHQRHARHDTEYQSTTAQTTT